MRGESLDPVPVPRGQGRPGKQKLQSSPLLFIDTNILLDFYRARKDAAVSLLSKIDGLHDRTIVTCQVEMEFKKNRHGVINDAVKELKHPDFNFPVPSFLSDAASVKVIKALNADAKARVEKLKKRILQTLEKPKTHDPIYRTVQRLFVAPGSLNLRQDSPEYRKVWRLALRRFMEGRPPRNKDDTSAGDAVNWEWIIQCMKQTKRDVIIVSRDSDYGVTLNDKSHANDWLAEEVKQRVSPMRKIILVNQLARALKIFAIPVTKAELSVERAIITPRANRNDDEAEEIIGDSIENLLNEDEISSLVADTNTDGWSCNEFKVVGIEHHHGACIADVTFSFSGEQRDDRPWTGDKISGRCLATIDPDKEVSFSNIEAKSNRDDDGHDEDEVSEK